MLDKISGLVIIRENNSSLKFYNFHYYYLCEKYVCGIYFKLETRLKNTCGKIMFAERLDKILMFC
jgi:hypothetical protein